MPSLKLDFTYQSPWEKRTMSLELDPSNPFSSIWEVVKDLELSKYLIASPYSIFREGNELRHFYSFFFHRRPQEFKFKVDEECLSNYFNSLSHIHSLFFEADDVYLATNSNSEVARRVFSSYEVSVNLNDIERSVFISSYLKAKGVYAEPVLLVLGRHSPFKSFSFVYVTDNDSYLIDLEGNVLISENLEDSLLDYFKDFPFILENFSTLEELASFKFPSAVVFKGGILTYHDLETSNLFPKKAVFNAPDIFLYAKGLKAFSLLAESMLL